MADNLLPMNGIDENFSAGRSDQTEIRYRNGIAFDYQTGDFKRDGKNKILDSDGIESWKSWCYNCLQTERYKHLAYSTDFGIETDAAFRASSPDEAESILTREITEAIMADPYQRTLYIPEIRFVWVSPDEVEVYVTIQGVDDVTIDIIAYITKGGIVA